MHRCIGGLAIAQVGGAGAGQQAHGQGAADAGGARCRQAVVGAPPRPQLVVQRLQPRQHLLKVRPAYIKVIKA